MLLATTLAKGYTGRFSHLQLSSPPRYDQRCVTPWDTKLDEFPSSRASSDAFELSIAPMMKQTDFHFHYLMRHFTKRTRLYTEMIVDDTILHQLENLKRFIGYNRSTHPITVQLGGNDPEKLAKAAKICEEWGYDEINLNVVVQALGLVRNVLVRA